MNRLLRNVITSGTAAGVGGPKAGGMESVGKTGTASDWKDYAFVGLTPYYVTAVWWGFDNPYDMYHSGYSALKNNKPCIQAWKALMEAVQGDLEFRAFPMAEGVKQAAYCTESGIDWVLTSGVPCATLLSERDAAWLLCGALSRSPVRCISFFVILTKS